MNKTITVPRAWLEGLQKSQKRVEKTLARAALKPDLYVQSELTYLFGYLDSIDYLLKNKSL